MMKLYKAARRYGSKAAIVGGAMLASATPALAETEWVTIPSTIDVAPVGTFLGVILTAIAAIWIGRKLIKFGNKS